MNWWNPFRQPGLLSEEDSYFQLECYRWLLMNFGGDSFYKNSGLILPTVEYFPAMVTSGESAARTTFSQVLKHAGMEEWPVNLVMQSEDPDRVVGPSLLIQSKDHNPLGTFSVSENHEVTITYNPKVVSNPMSMVATFAHELAHYLTGYAKSSPPGGWENWEFATDIAATFMGFGIFQANSAFNFKQYSTPDGMGWETTGAGYLTVAEHSYALAVFLKLKNIDPKIAMPHCDPNVKHNLKKALKELDRNDVIAILNAI